eukprot:5689383-Pleurochrysis_carterae.AAC.3
MDDVEDEQDSEDGGGADADGPHPENADDAATGDEGGKAIDALGPGAEDIGAKESGCDAAGSTLKVTGGLNVHIRSKRSRSGGSNRSETDEDQDDDDDDDDDDEDDDDADADDDDAEDESSSEESRQDDADYVDADASDVAPEQSGDDESSDGGESRSEEEEETEARAHPEHSVPLRLIYTVRCILQHNAFRRRFCSMYMCCVVPCEVALVTWRSLARAVSVLAQDEDGLPALRRGDAEEARLICADVPYTESERQQVEEQLQARMPSRERAPFYVELMKPFAAHQLSKRPHLL